MRVVFDASVVASGCCWDGEAYQCLAAIARRRIAAYATSETLRECSDTVLRLIRERTHAIKAKARLDWYANTVKVVDPAPLGKQRSRDPKDDPYLAAALAARADIIVTYDNDLLALKKPFGIEIMRPSQLLQLSKGSNV